jgi:hypothetical protein
MDLPPQQFETVCFCVFFPKFFYKNCKVLRQAFEKKIKRNQSTMRVCGSCRFGRFSTSYGFKQANEMLKDVKPAAALVLVFSESKFGGSHGIVAQIQDVAASKPRAMAAAYCEVCRCCTWLCSAESDINVACLEFLHLSRTADQIEEPIALMHG